MRRPFMILSTLVLALGLSACSKGPGAPPSRQTYQIEAVNFITQQVRNNRYAALGTKSVGYQMRGEIRVTADGKPIDRNGYVHVVYSEQTGFHGSDRPESVLVPVHQGVGALQVDFNLWDLPLNAPVSPPKIEIRKAAFFALEPVNVVPDGQEGAPQTGKVAVRLKVTGLPNEKNEWGSYRSVEEVTVTGVGSLEGRSLELHLLRTILKDKNSANIGAVTSLTIPVVDGEGRAYPTGYLGDKDTGERGEFDYKVLGLLPLTPTAVSKR